MKFVDPPNGSHGPLMPTILELHGVQDSEICGADDLKKHWLFICRVSLHAHHNEAPQNVML